MRALAAADSWGVDHVAVGVARDGAVIATGGDAHRVFRWASVTKLLTALAVLVAVEEGSVDLDGPAGPPGSTVRHLLAHASGLPFEGARALAPPGKRRVYSNPGYVVLAQALERGTGIPFREYVREAVLAPVGMSSTGLNDAEPHGIGAAGAYGPLVDLLRLGQELQRPRIVAPETLAEAVAVAFEGLEGIVPGFGRQRPNDWGLGFELRDGKDPHWTGSTNSPRTFGHFGGSGTFLWIDPDVGVALACLTDRAFGDWAAAAWPPFSDAVIAEASA